MIRKAKIEDLKDIINMWARDKNNADMEVLSEPLSEQYLKAFDEINNDARQHLMVFESNGEVLGSLQLTFIQYLFRHARKVALIESVIVKEDSRGNGIGEKLIKWAIEKSKEEGATLVQLTSNKNRLKAFKFYEKLGFLRSHEGFKLKLD